MQTLINQLKPMTTWNDFARSLCDQYESKGTLSEKQISSAERMINKMATNRIARQSKIKTVDTTKIDELFSTAQSNGLKRPNFYVGDLRLSLANERSKNFGSIYVQHSGEYMGKITSNTFYPLSTTPQSSIDLLVKIAEDPKQSAIEHGKMSNHCSMCNKELTDEHSIEVGYGKRCSENWGLEY
jgi:hypothetical protein